MAAVNSYTNSTSTRRPTIAATRCISRQVDLVRLALSLAELERRRLE